MSLMVQKIREKYKDIVFVYQYYLGIRFLISFLTSVIIVKSSMSLTDIGYFEINMFLVMTLSFGWSVGLKNALLSLFPKTDVDDIPKLISSVFWVLMTFSIVFGLILYFFSSSIIYLLTDYDVVPFLNIGALYLLVSVPTVLIENVLYLKKETKKLLNYTHWSQGVQLVLVIFIAVFSPTLVSFLWVLVFISFLKMIYLAFFVMNKSMFVFDQSSLKKLVIFSAPLLLYVLLGSGMDLIDGLFVTHFFDDQFFAIYKYGAREMPFSSLLFSSLSTAMIPVLMNNGTNSSELKARCTKLMHLVFPIAILLMISSPFIFELVYDAEFRESAFIFNVYLLILTSRVLLPQTYNLALHQHKIIVWSGIIEIVSNVILSLWLVRDFGVYGLAVATVIAYLIQKIILIFYNKVVNSIDLNQYLDLKWYGIYTVTLIISFIFTLNLHL